MRAEPRGQTRPWAFLAYLVVILSFVAVLAHHKLLWFDELMTLYIAQRPSLGDLWAALCDGPDPAPPLHLLLVRGSVALLGENHIGIRMPAMLGFLLMLVCLKLLANKDFTHAAAWLAVIAPVPTFGFAYAYEARAYGLWMGLTALALWLWRVATDGGSRSQVAAVGLAFTLAAAISTHWYAVLLVVPLGLGELERTYRTRRFASSVWLALGLGFVPILFYGPLLANGRQYSGNFWAKPTWDAIPATYALLLRWPAYMAMAIGFLVVLGRVLPIVRGHHRSQGLDPLPQTVPRHQLVAAGALFLLPCAELLLARLMHGGYTVRYALPSLVGLAWLAAFVADWLDRRGYLDARLAAAVVLAGGIVLNIHGVIRSPKLHSWETRRPPFPEVLVALPDDHLPVVVVEATQYLPLAYYYGNNGLGRPIVYLPHQDPEQDTLWISMPKLRPMVDLLIPDLKPFLAEHPHFYLAEIKPPYLRKQIEAEGAKVTLMTKSGEQTLYEVSQPSSAGSKTDQ